MRIERGQIMLTEEFLLEQAGKEEFSQGQTLFHRALVREARRGKSTGGSGGTGHGTGRRPGGGHRTEEGRGRKDYL